MAFELFDKDKSYYGMREDKPFAAFWSTAKILTFNVSAIKQYKLTPGRHCDLYFDKSKRIVGIKPSRNQVYGIPIKIPKTRQGKNFAYMSVGRFIKHFNIELPPKRTRYPLTKNKNGMICLSLSNGESIKMGRPPQ